MFEMLNVEQKILGVFLLMFSIVSFNLEKGDAGNAILDTKSQIVLDLFSVCNIKTGVS